MAEISSSTLINIHTHASPRDDEFGIISCRPGLVNQVTGRPDQFVSAGIHPWEAGAGDAESQLSLLEELAARREVIAVGESGLDRLKGPGLDVQYRVLVAQAEIARRAGKPMIIHCVRAFPEIISARKSFASAPPWIIHGFTGNIQTMQQLITHGFYISFGPTVLNPSGKLAIVIMNVPLERIFFETDGSGGPVSDVYKSFSSSREIEVGHLVKVVSENFASLFKI
jgi:TatD DNase family protein